MEIVVGDDLLSPNEQERADFLKEYFCELTATSSEVPGGWFVTLARPATADCYVDPRLAEGLRWWSETYRPTDVAEIPFAHHQASGFHISLNDTWTTYSWSRWLAGLPDGEALPLTTTLLHLDDHDDFMTPRLIIEGAEWRDAITGRVFDLRRPETVESAARSGAIGMGSIVAPLLHALPCVHVRHLCATEYSRKRKGPHVIYPVRFRDNLLAPGAARPALKLEPAGAPAPAGHTREHPYLVTDDVEQWLEDLPGGPVLIHVDMDYFNNRFDGDSDRVEHDHKYEQPLAKVLERIDEVFEALDRRGLAERVADMAVGVSPGFFPAEFWGPSVARIEQHVGRLLGQGRWAVRE
ncbi:MAG: hypothetical protein M3416_00595 [Acidobacteriota bacterium]|nr:hypothetical protein [Acidobacteriota bacterium]